MIRELPAKRRSETIKEKIGTIKIFVTFGHYEDGALGEVFIDVAKEGDTIRSWMNAFAMMTSLSLQHGAAPIEIVRMLHGFDFEPRSAVWEEHEYRSIVDYLAHLIAERYCSEEELKQHGITLISSRRS